MHYFNPTIWVKWILKKKPNNEFDSLWWKKLPKIVGKTGIENEFHPQFWEILLMKFANFTHSHGYN
jgi:hypothetical protein